MPLNLGEVIMRMNNKVASNGAKMPLALFVRSYPLKATWIFSRQHK
ncbi:MAG: hypothetical protein WCB90_11795 [Methanosarcina sp.]